MQRPMSLVVQSIIAAVILAVGAGLWIKREPVSAAVTGLFGEAEPAKRSRRRNQGAVPVITRPVGEARDNLTFAGIGTARAERHVTLYAAVPGEVVKLHTRAGQTVNKGDKLIELDARQAELSVAMAKSKLQNATTLLQRADRLRRRNVQSEAKVDDAEMIAVQARVELKAAEATLSDHVVRAPFAGIVGIANVDVGDRVTATTELLTIDDRSSLTVQFDIPEQFLPHLQPGQKVDVRTPGFPDRIFVGEIDKIDSRVHPTRRTVVVRAKFDNEKDLLRPGMSFEVDLQITGEQYPEIADLALQFSQKGNYVWLIEDDKAKRVPVRIVRRRANTVLVSGELRPGDVVVIEGVQRLRPGREVERSGQEPQSGAGGQAGAQLNITRRRTE